MASYLSLPDAGSIVSAFRPWIRSGRTDSTTSTARYGVGGRGGRRVPLSRIRTLEPTRNLPGPTTTAF